MSRQAGHFRFLPIKYWLAKKLFNHQFFGFNKILALYF